MEKTTGQVNKKAPNPTGKGGFGDNPQNINPGGEPKNSLKSYVASKLAKMTDEQKDVWLKERKISGIDEWKMGEGNPATNTDIKLEGELIVHIAKEIAEKNDINTSTEEDSKG